MLPMQDVEGYISGDQIVPSIILSIEKEEIFQDLYLALKQIRERWFPDANFLLLLFCFV